MSCKLLLFSFILYYELHCIVSLSLGEPHICWTIHPGECCDTTSNIHRICYKKCYTIPCDFIAFISDDPERQKKSYSSSSKSLEDLQTIPLTTVFKLLKPLEYTVMNKSSEVKSSEEIFSEEDADTTYEARIYGDYFQERPESSERSDYSNFRLISSLSSEDTSKYYEENPNSFAYTVPLSKTDPYAYRKTQKEHFKPGYPFEMVEDKPTTSTSLFNMFGLEKKVVREREASNYEYTGQDYTDYAIPIDTSELSYELNIDSYNQRNLQQSLSRCCVNSGVNHECMIMCDYKSNRKTMSNIINSNDRAHCLQYVNHVILCANQQQDNTVCCDNLTKVAPNCHRYCDPTRYLFLDNFTQNDYICAKHWDTVMTCHMGGVFYDRRRRKIL